MIIDSLRMKNFKSHTNTTIEFNTGITIIMGGNGAGKSSILEAVSFALFKQHSSKKIEQLITIGGKNPKMFVELQFTSNGRTYLVKRERSKTASSKATIMIREGQNFYPLSSGDTQVTKEIQNILEMDGDLFLNAVYVRQGEIADLVEKTPAEKKQVIGKLLGLESLEKAWKNMLPIINTYEMKKIKIEAKLETVDDLNRDIEAKTNEKLQIKSKIQYLSSEIEDAQKHLDLIGGKKEKLDNDKTDYENISSDLTSKQRILETIKDDEIHLKKQIEDINSKEIEIEEIKPKLFKLELLIKLRDSIKQLKDIQNDEKEINKTLEKISTFKDLIMRNEAFYNDYSVVVDEINAIEEKRSGFEGSRALLDQYSERKKKTIEKMGKSHDRIVKVLNNANKDLGTDFSLIEELGAYIKSKEPEIQQHINELNNKINQINEEISNLKTQNKDLEKPISELEYVKERCPICKSPIDAIKRDELIQGYSDQIKSNVNKISSLNSALNIFLKDKEVFDSKYSDISSINIEVLFEQFEKLEEGQQDLKTIKEKISNLETDVTILNQIDIEIQEKKSGLKDLKPKYEEYIGAKGSLKSIGDQDEYKNKLQNLQETESLLKEDISRLIEVTEGSVENLDNEIEYLERLKLRYQHLSGAIALKESSINRMKKVKASVDDYESQIKKINLRLNEIAYDDVIHNKIIQEIELENQDLKKLNDKKQELIGKESGVGDVLDELRTKLKSYSSYKLEVKKLGDFIKLLNYIRELYAKDGVQKDLRNISRPLIEQNTREFFERFNFEYSDIKLDNEYDVTVYGPGGESDLDMISGGEKIAVALALRLGITQTLSGGNLEMIMLDEPTIHLDAYRRQELIDLLKRMSIIPQMIIVTHDSDLEDAADNILRVVKEEGKSKIVE